MKKRRYNKSMNELREIRKELGLTQIQAANACGVSRRTYQTYEETTNKNSTAEELYRKLKEMGVFDGPRYVCNIRQIKYACKQVFSSVPEISCVYLFGSYARGEATIDSDVDILVVAPPIGMKLFGLAAQLEDLLHKQVDLHTHRQMIKNEVFAQEILKEGIKIYG